LVVVKVAMPTTRTAKEPGRASTVRVSPIRTSLFFAVSASSRAWPAPRGACPLVSFTGLRSVGYQLVATVGAPVVGPTDSLSPSTTVTFSTDASTWASATPSMPATRRASAAGTVSTAPVGS
jgi:hypothetical protein